MPQRMSHCQKEEAHNSPNGGCAGYRNYTFGQSMEPGGPSSSPSFWVVVWRGMFKKIAVTVSAAAFVMLAIALAPNVPTALATARATITKDDAQLKHPAAEQPCAAFEAWFLDPNCRHAKKL